LNRVLPYNNTATFKLTNDRNNQISRNFNGNLTLQTQKMKTHQHFNEKEGMYAPHESTYKTYKKGVPTGVADSNKMKSYDTVNDEQTPEEKQTNLNFEYNPQFQEENPMENIRNEKNFSKQNISKREKIGKISPEQRFHKTHEVNNQSSPRRSANNSEVEDSMKMEDILHDFEDTHKN